MSDDDSSDQGSVIMGRKSILQRLEANAAEDNEDFSGEEDAVMDTDDNIDSTTKDLDANGNPTKEFTRNRLLLVPGRGISYRFRHLLNDLASLCPHAKKSEKFDSKSNLFDLNELAELNNCNLLMYFETRKQKDLYLWMSKTPNGPSVRFQVSNSILIFN